MQIKIRISIRKKKPCRLKQNRNLFLNVQISTNFIRVSTYDDTQMLILSIFTFVSKFEYTK